MLIRVFYVQCSGLKDTHANLRESEENVCINRERFGAYRTFAYFATLSHCCKSFLKKKRLVDVVDIVTSAGQQFLDSVAVVALELNRVLLYCSSACKSSLEEFG